MAETWRKKGVKTYQHRTVEKKMESKNWDEMKNELPSGKTTNIYLSEDGKGGNKKKELGTQKDRAFKSHAGEEGVVGKKYSLLRGRLDKTEGKEKKGMDNSNGWTKQGQPFARRRGS